MPRSHPPTLITLCRRTLREECELPRGARVLVAVSGGRDSTALLHVLQLLAAELGFELMAHGVDHGLRPEAPLELGLVNALAERLGVPFSQTKLQVAPGGNLQARARSARYAALRRAGAELGVDVIATAHHADDRAETVLLRLLRGAGPRGLAVLPPRDGALIRPLIRARRSDVAAHLNRHQLRFAEDPSNLDRRFLRVRVRTELLPLLEQLSPAIVTHLNALADDLRAAPAPRLLDASGIEIPLGRAHLRQLRRAQKFRQKQARIRLPGSKELRLDPRSLAPIVAPARQSRAKTHR
jgi:tRNA(Ile)-lysidine synthase